jgi:hypothetical protein
MSLPGEQTTQTLIEALKTQPATLAMIVSNLLLLGFLYYQGVIAHRERLEETKLLYENRQFVGNLLANCYPAPPKQDH